VYNELERIWKEVVVAKFKIPSQAFVWGLTETSPNLRILGVLAEVRPRNLPIMITLCIPLSLLGNGSVKIPLSLLGNGSVKVPLLLLGNGSVKIPLSLLGNGSVKIPLSLLGNGSIETLPR
jgi:hypothetical protein